VEALAPFPDRPFFPLRGGRMFMSNKAECNIAVLASPVDVFEPVKGGSFLVDSID